MQPVLLLIACQESIALRVCTSHTQDVLQGLMATVAHHDETRLLSCEAFQEMCCSFIRLPALQDALQGLMAAMAQYGETRDLSGSEKPLFTAAAQSAIKVRLSAYETRPRVCAQGLFCCRTLTSFSQTWMQDQVACRARLLEP